LGSGILKILSPPQLLHNKVLNFVWFFSHSFEPGLSLLLWGTSFDDTMVINDASGGVEAIFFSVRLSDVRRTLTLLIRVLPQGLSTISFKVTRFITIEAFEDFPLPYWRTSFLPCSF
jgi:hypothetical protein